MITTDSRQIEKNCLFVAIKGARVDGNDFVLSAYENQALCCMSERVPENRERPYIVVKSCYQALKEMAAKYPRRSCSVSSGEKRAWGVRHWSRRISSRAFGRFFT